MKGRKGKKVKEAYGEWREWSHYLEGGKPNISEEDLPLKVLTQLKIRPKILGD